jgi:hypothetical protein
MASEEELQISVKFCKTAASVEAIFTEKFLVSVTVYFKFMKGDRMSDYICLRR